MFKKHYTYAINLPAVHCLKFLPKGSFIVFFKYERLFQSYSSLETLLNYVKILFAVQDQTRSLKSTQRMGDPLAQCSDSHKDLCSQNKIFSCSSIKFYCVQTSLDPGCRRHNSSHAYHWGCFNIYLCKDLYSEVLVCKLNEGQKSEYSTNHMNILLLPIGVPSD